MLHINIKVHKILKNRILKVPIFLNAYITKMVTINTHIHTQIYTHLSEGMRKENETVRSINVKFRPQNLSSIFLTLKSMAAQVKCFYEKLQV